ncbi:MAG: hypothetical protein H5T81_11190 [Tetrasphaera sp.]|nr:hypothetical protein [Tetrasphaera sp.]
MTAILRVNLGEHAEELQNLPITVNGVQLGVTKGETTEVEVEPGWSIIEIGHGFDSTAPARFHAYRVDHVDVYVHRYQDDRVPAGGILGGRYYLTVEHSQPTPPDPDA